MASAEEVSPTDTPAALAKDGIRRTRELYRYLTPASLSSTPALRPQDPSKTDALYDAPNLTPSLIPFVQLVALRCDTSKAILTVIDRDTMYFLAQVSKRSHNGPKDTPMFETTQDSVLMGCTSVPVSGRVCELTIRMRANDTCQYSFFTVPDMSKDARFSNLDVVAAGPKFRFYCGTPITTKNGVNIGSLAVMDTQPRESLNDDEERCLGETAAHIMRYLELNREAIEGRQARRMGHALNSFVAGRNSLADVASGQLVVKQPSKRSSYSIDESAVTPHPTSHLHSPNRRDKRKKHSAEEKNNNNVVLSKANSDDDASDPSTKDQAEPATETDELDSRSHSKTYARAANLIREALELGDDGGVLFISVTAESTIPTFLSNVKASIADDSTSTGDEFQPEKVAVAKLAELVRSPTFMKNSSAIPASTLASSTKSRPLLEGNEVPGKGGIKLDSEVVNYFVGRYPGGRLLLLEEDDGRSSSDETAQEIEAHKGTKTSRMRRRVAEIEFLRRAFPDARQLLMVPLWDASQGRISSACFAWATTQSRLFSSRHELSYLTSFCQTLMAECSRLDAMAADKQKSDFVSTISHELRSPLHGILASVEFLSDSNLTSFQDSIIHTIDACGKTLLDTINHVLDFSKINSFEKNWQDSNKHNDKSREKFRSVKPDPLGGSALATSAPPLLQLFGVVDISVVLEEVVEGITAGFTYSHSIDLTDTSKAARGRASNSGAGIHESVQASSESDAVEVILDIEPDDWVFMTQPGAVRRIIMNIFGNAIKYTTHGSVKVRLELNDMDVIFTVTDTGKGISPRFLNSRLFMPFAQENALAPGTGLGLSICKSIITMLGGNIDIRSRVNSGTTVKVSLPLIRPGPNNGSGSTEDTPHSRETSASSIFSAPNKTIPEIRNHANRCRVALYQAPEADQHLSTRELGSVLEKYISHWYGLQLVQLQSLHANIVLLEEQDLQLFTKQHPTMLDKVALIVLCHDASRRSQALTTEGLQLTQARVMEYVAKPVGPHKLAKVVRACMDKLEGPHFATFGATPGLSTPGPAPEIADAMNELTLGELGDKDQIVVQATEVLSASQTSRHAQHAINSPSLQAPASVNDKDEFPFPEINTVATSPPKLRRLTVSKSSGLSIAHLPTPASESSEGPTPMAPQPLKSLDPRMLIVDDNAINLKLLHTFLRKRNCSQVSSAENGAIAVELFTSAPSDQPYEIVFMDVSMPVMNGFEATRAIRDFEDKNNVQSPAMVIALTGLASGRDQAEGFASGCDIYLTKPVSFKEVGRLLDNWGANQKRHANGDVVTPVAVVSGGVTEMGLQHGKQD